MGARAVRGTSAHEAEPLADVLGPGEDEPAWRPGRTRARGAAALVLAGVAGLVLPASLSGDGPEGVARVELTLPEGAVALPRRDAAPVEGRVQGGFHVEVVNEGREPVRLLSAALSPGEWQVAVVDDLDGAADPAGRGRLLRPGWSAVVVLHRAVLCTPGADHGPVPTTLVVEVELGGRQRRSSLDLGGDQPGYGGRLQDALGFPQRFCSPDGRTATAGTVGDPGLPFLSLWPAGPGVLPVP